MNQTANKKMMIRQAAIMMLSVIVSSYTSVSLAALSVDHSRLILNEGEKAVSITVHNQNNHVPYLAQAWLEDASGQKISQPLVALPPIQRIEAGSKTSVRVQDINSHAQLPSDRESVFYFNLREVPPKSEKKNSLQLALQTRLKVFYRPKQLKVERNARTVPGMEKLSIRKEGKRYQVTNPTPYFITVVSARKILSGSNVDKFEPFLISPYETVTVNWNEGVLVNTLVLSTINDYGARVDVSFKCNNQFGCRVNNIAESGGER
ncbi:Chaperone protein papD precursor [Serratia entomophila]|uniref:SefG n=1 Tax=Serratia entomophila TaxID=42906 RepID=Q7BQT3_9GAMM|nr:MULTISPECIES: fimbria/pilus periplasmic chaperone [Serratia]AAR13153.1 SefG [Serratia entomophila]UIW20843.1 fimbria/pilus periplasmic chaperone [Serratia entomophila]ULG10334.1 SefG [Serratia entomophila]ULG10613.1 SefG [Serratia entomophila]ULG10832.1 SefG [Serratia entomophila]